MLRFLFGVVVGGVGLYVCTNHSDKIHETFALARDQLRLASSNVSAIATDEPSSRPEDQPITIDYARAKRLAGSMRSMSAEELWRFVQDSDYDRRAAAGQVLLSQAGIPISSDGIDAVRRQYLTSSHVEDRMTGFSYLGLLAVQRVPQGSIVRLAQGYVERNPRDRVCDNALWALGEVGSEDLVPYFFEIASNPGKYGPVARERAFCCLAQCGRYSAARRFDMIGDFIDVHDQTRDQQTRQWAIQALSHCAPGVQARSVQDWKRWWAEQNG
jgi:HEAT repeat protein